MSESILPQPPVDTELPAAAAPAANTTTPTAPAVAGYLVAQNKTDGNWDPVQSGADDNAAQVDGVLRMIPVTHGGWDVGNSGDSGDANAGNRAFYVVPSYYNGTNWDRQRSVVVGDAAAATGIGAAGGMLFNGTTWDRERNDTEITILTSAARTVTTTSADFTAHNAESLLLMINVTSIGTASFTPSIQGKEPISGAYFTYWTAEYPIITAGTFSYFFANGASGGEFTECLAFGLGPRVFRITMTVNNANSATYSCSAVLGDN